MYKHAARWFSLHFSSERHVSRCTKLGAAPSRQQATDGGRDDDDRTLEGVVE